MKKNIFEIVEFAKYTCFFYFKLKCLGIKTGFSLKNAKRNHFAYGNVFFRGRIGSLLLGKYLRILGDITIIYSDDSLGSLAIGDDVILEKGATLAPRQGKIDIGRRCFIGPDVLLQSYSGVEILIDDDAMIAKGAVVLASNHDISSPCDGYQREVGRSVRIGKNAWVGAGAKILAGVSVGDFAVIAAGAVLTKNAEAYSVYAGIPAVKIKEFDAIDSEWKFV